MLLFSYGSNSPQQLAVRLGHPVQGEAAYLPRHRRVFRGWSHNWHGGVASVVPDAGRHVFGYVFEADDDDVEILDQYEGVATGYYTRNRVTVTLANGDQVAASVYKATSTEPSKPSRRYLKTIADTVGSFWAGEITWRSFPTANDGRGPRKKGRGAFEDEGFVGQFWGSSGSGILLQAADTGRYLLMLRSWGVEDPNTWGVPGGAVPRDRRTGNPKDTWDSARQETQEETGARVPKSATVQGEYVWEANPGGDGFVFTTFVVRSKGEFEPTVNWESERGAWFTLEEALAMDDLHHGVRWVMERLDRG
jgi:8-oxo-dGTP pyrophosphatase MutT (NUDIX family)/gamma-glutamylcyclotransferase (GGCT)/AIG2-like uncharacterized protein YtfP